jgi:hypothetical protein
MPRLSLCEREKQERRDQRETKERASAARVSGLHTSAKPHDVSGRNRKTANTHADSYHMPRRLRVIIAIGCRKETAFAS